MLSMNDFFFAFAILRPPLVSTLDWVVIAILAFALPFAAYQCTVTGCGTDRCKQSTRHNGNGVKFFT
jgi:hypothetical protein